MRVRIPHLTETDADRITAELEREPGRVPRRPARETEPRQRTPRRRHHNEQRSAAA